MKHRAQTIRFLTEVLVRRLSWTLPAVHESMAQILASELRARFNLGTVSQPMQAKETNGDDAQQTMGPDRLLSSWTRKELCCRGSSQWCRSHRGRVRRTGWFPSQSIP